MKSMTGYGKATVVCGNRELTVELKSVNHRFLDITTKIPRSFIAYEDAIRSGLSRGLSRGHVDVFVNYKLTEQSDKVVSVDLALAEGYYQASQQLKQAFPSLKDDFTLGSLMRSGEVISLVQQEDDEKVIRQMVVEAVDKAVLELNKMREVEGNKLRADILQKLDFFEQLLGKVQEYAPNVVVQYTEKLRQRMADLLKEVAIDEAKLSNEICFYADKSCIDEEITRLKTHITHAREILATEQSVGRKLDFLIQEFNRETNTICSKSGIVELTNVALKMKNEIDKIREQIQNLE
ncbi:MAG: YicC family protein [Clostridia bacterium]|nr:YicC family protein [Clostridia bacterium]